MPVVQHGEADETNNDGGTLLDLVRPLETKNGDGDYLSVLQNQEIRISVLQQLVDELTLDKEHLNEQKVNLENQIHEKEKMVTDMAIQIKDKYAEIDDV